MKHSFKNSHGTLKFTLTNFKVSDELKEMFPRQSVTDAQWSNDKHTLLKGQNKQIYRNFKYCAKINRFVKNSKYATQLNCLKHIAPQIEPVIRICTFFIVYFPKE